MFKNLLAKAVAWLLPRIVEEVKHEAAKRGIHVAERPSEAPVMRFPRE